MPKDLGGKNHVQFFALTSASGVITFGTSQLTNNQVFSVSYTGNPKSKNIKLSLDSDLGSAELDAMLQTYLVAQAAPETGVYEDNVASTPNAGVYSSLLGVIAHGPVNTATGKCKTFIGIGQIEGGDFKTEANKSTRTKLDFVGLPADYQVVIPANKFNSAKVSDGALTTLTTGIVGSYFYFTPA